MDDMVNVTIYFDKDDPIHIEVCRKCAELLKQHKAPECLACCTAVKCACEEGESNG